VQGNKIVDQHGEIVTLEGMSLFWSQWIDKYYNYDCIRWLRDDWHCDIIRIAMGISGKGGYIDDPEDEMKKVCRVIDGCINLGIYVIIDWHSYKAESKQEEAIAFFSEIARKYGDKPNVIYEIYNEPLQVSWDKVVKPYHKAVISAIRNYDADNIIVAGTPC
jgi:endoglucanase